MQHNRSLVMNSKLLFPFSIYFSEYLFKNNNATIYIVENWENIPINFFYYMKVRSGFKF